MDDPLSLSTYEVERTINLVSITSPLKFTDPKGNIVLLTKANPIVTRQTLETTSGKVLGTVTHKVVSLMPTYELHEGDVKGKIIGIIKQRFDLGNILGKTIDIEDASGNVIATATGNFGSWEYTIVDKNGTLIAKVEKKNTKYDQGILRGVLEQAKELAVRSYILEIVQKNRLPTLTLLEFLVVMEIMIGKGERKFQAVTKL